MASNVSILAHVLGKAPETGGSYLMQNRIIGQVNATQVTTCSPARCKGTLRPTGCTCTKGAEAGKGCESCLSAQGIAAPSFVPSLLCLVVLSRLKKTLLLLANGAYLMEAKSDQVHTIWQTPSYGMGAVVFSPNDYFSPNSQQRWVGLIFNGERAKSSCL